MPLFGKGFQQSFRFFFFLFLFSSTTWINSEFILYWFLIYEIENWKAWPKVNSFFSLFLSWSPTGPFFFFSSQTWLKKKQELEWQTDGCKWAYKWHDCSNIMSIWPSMSSKSYTSTLFFFFFLSFYLIINRCLRIMLILLLHNSVSLSSTR